MPALACPAQDESRAVIAPGAVPFSTIKRCPLSTTIKQLLKACQQTAPAVDMEEAFLMIGKMLNHYRISEQLVPVK